jgi:hypothetical protein
MNLPDSFSYIRGRETLARAQVLKRSWPVVLDLCVAGIGLAFTESYGSRTTGSVILCRRS